MLLTEFKGLGEGGLGKAHLLRRHLLMWVFVPGTILGTGNIAMNKAQKLLLSPSWSLV